MSTENVPGLGELSESIRLLAKQLAARISMLEDKVHNNDTASRGEMESLHKFKNCVQSSATITSSISSQAMTVDGNESVAASDLLDIFSHRPKSQVVAWVTSTSQIDLDTPMRNDSFPVPVISIYQPQDTDSDDEIEAELMNLHLSQGRQQLQVGDFVAAERHLERGLKRLRKSKSRENNISTYTCGLEDLTEVYRRQERWRETKDIILERLALLSRTATADSIGVLDLRLALADVLIELNDSVEARLHVKACTNGYRKMGPDGGDGFAASVLKMIEICIREDDVEGEEDYRMLLTQVYGQVDTAGFPLVQLDGAGFAPSPAVKDRKRPHARPKAHDQSTTPTHTQVESSRQDKDATVRPSATRPRPPPTATSKAEKNTVSQSSDWYESVLLAQSAMEHQSHDVAVLTATTSPSIQDVETLSLATRPYARGLKDDARGFQNTSSNHRSVSNLEIPSPETGHSAYDLVERHWRVKTDPRNFNRRPTQRERSGNPFRSSDSVQMSLIAGIIRQSLRKPR